MLEMHLLSYWFQSAVSFIETQSQSSGLGDLALYGGPRRSLTLYRWNEKYKSHFFGQGVFPLGFVSDQAKNAGSESPGCLSVG